MSLYAFRTEQVSKFKIKVIYIFNINIFKKMKVRDVTFLIYAVELNGQLCLPQQAHI